jgi:hypothetical protein
MLRKRIERARVELHAVIGCSRERESREKKKFEREKI